MAKRLRWLMGSKAVLLVLQHTYGKLTLPGAWVFQKDCKKSHVWAVNHVFVALAVHNSAFAALASRLVEWLCSFLLAACALDVLRKLCVAAPTEVLQAILRGWHWIRAQNLPQHLAHLGFLPSGWSLLRDLLPQQEGQAMQKVHELICWWRVGNRISRRHSLAAELNGRFADDAEVPTDAELNFLHSEGFMLRKQEFERDESTFVVPSKAPDEVVSGWSVNPRVCMPKTVRTRNRRLIVANLLSKSELSQKDCLAVYWASKDLAALTKKVVTAWAAPLGKPAVAVLEFQPASRPVGQVCAVAGCGTVCGERALRSGAFVGLCEGHLAEQCVGDQSANVSWSADRHCTGCWSAVTTSDSWLLSSGHRTCRRCAAAVEAELHRVVNDPALQRLACGCLLQHPLHFSLDGHACCPGCRKRLVNAMSSARRMVVRLAMLWLKACHQLWPRIVGTARGVHLSLGR